MKLALGFCLLIWISSPVTAQKAANGAAAGQIKVIALENAWNQAQLHHDAKAMDDLIPNTFIYTDNDGTVMNKAQFLADRQDPRYRTTLITNEGAEVFPYQNVTIVIGTRHTKGTYQGEAFEHYSRFTDTWVYQHSRWLCVASQTSLIKK